MCQINLFDIWTMVEQIIYAKLLEIEHFDNLTVSKQMTNV